MGTYGGTNIRKDGHSYNKQWRVQRRRRRTSMRRTRSSRVRRVRVRALRSYDCGKR
jgi:hypothetical protein